ncbi:anthrone oxygenase family protein [Sediminibacter sp. Hel_I_10]|uniref:anthrone oxygenase family protein n=1 Tax=Sediminibacter sp. Hel_I_10 TaxID=1392490 RepID=UPI00047B35CF|nr:anthrone oxygenase family protein [Sediminibacter sp. Hel_I_10]
MKKILPFIAIIASAAFVGNMITIGLSHCVHWQSLDPITFMETFKVDFPLLLGPTAVTLMPGFLATLSLVILTKDNKEAKRYYLYAFLGLLLTIIQTAVYHLPMNFDFMELKYSAAEATSKLQGWVFFHWVRIGVAIMAAVFLILGFQKSNLITVDKSS